MSAGRLAASIRLDAHRARVHRPSDRDRPAHAAAETQPDRRDARVRDRPDLTPDEREESLDDLQREIAAAWQTDEVRRELVTPLDEVRAGLVVFEQSLWEALPQYLRAVDRALHAATGTRLPLDVAPIRFGSWMGGDRDGNPSVTRGGDATGTWLARWQAADLYLKEIVALRSELSLSGRMRARSFERACRRRARAVSRAPGRGARPPQPTRDLAEEALEESRAEADRCGAVPRGRRARRAAGAVPSIARPPPETR